MQIRAIGNTQVIKVNNILSNEFCISCNESASSKTISLRHGNTAV